MRIVTGTLRGRVIPAHRSFAGIRLTSSRLKEAIFSMLGGGLEDQGFLDLCAGSGQIGLEALSRSARVVFNEPDSRRCAQLRSLLKQWRIARSEVYCAKAQALIGQLQEQQRRFDIIYLDPPYHATRGAQPLCLALFDQLADGRLLAVAGLLLVQHRADLELPVAAVQVHRIEQRSFGSTVLSIYQVSPRSSENPTETDPDRGVRTG